MGNKHTPLYTCHQEMGAKIVDFSGWDMPIHYGSQLNEHHQVRRDCGMFDVSHMTILDINGPEAKKFLQYLFANDVARLKAPGKALYSCMLNEAGGVIDDLITYYMNDEWYRTVVNAATCDKDIAWITAKAKAFNVEITEQDQLSMIAVQGPNSRDIAVKLLPENLQEASAALKPFFATGDANYFVARTGYTGEDGFEIILPNDKAADLWVALNKAGVAPIGLGARDTLRLEAGMNLYGTDMDETVSPLAAGLNWTIAWQPEEREFIGREALTKAKESNQYKFVGLVLEAKGVIRNHQKVVLEGVGEGEVTSGSFSPTLGKAIALARIPKSNESHCMVEIRGKLIPAKIVKPTFVRNGKDCIQVFGA